MRRPLVLLLLIQCFIILTLFEFLHLELFTTRYSEYYDEVASIQGTVTSALIKEDYSALTVKTGKENVLVRLSGVEDEAYIYSLVGKSVKATGLVTKPAEARNPGTFNYARYLRARRTYAVMDVSKYKFEVTGMKNLPANYLSVQKGMFYTALRDMAGEETSSMIFGILFGDKSFLGDDVYGRFQKNGIAHILAVSGLHVGLVYTVIRRILKRKDRTASIISIISLFVYATLANYSVSVIRACIMICLKIAAFHLKRRYDMLSAACLTAMIMLSYNPYYIYDAGAQLSFAAVYGLSVVMPWMQSRLEKYCKKNKKERLFTVMNVLLPGIVLQITMTPLTAFHFLNFAPLALFVNPVAICLASFILPIGLLCFLVYPFQAALAASSFAAELLCMLLDGISLVSDKIASGIDVPAPPVSLMLLYYALLFFFFSEARYIMIRKAEHMKLTAITAVLAASCCLLPFAAGVSQSPLPWRYNRYDAVFVDIGQGDCTHIQSRGVHVLVDGGGNYFTNVAEKTLKPYLLKNGITHIDLAIVSHLDMDHSLGVQQLSEITDIRCIAFPASLKDEDLSDFKADEIIFLSEGDEISAGGALFRVLAAGNTPGVKTGSNEDSLVCLCSIGELDILLMADAPVEVENALVRGGELKGLDIEILKAGHHGSRTSTGQMLLSSNHFDTAVISCGKNNRYGHPSLEVLRRLEASGIEIRRTDLEGAICFMSVLPRR